MATFKIEPRKFPLFFQKYYWLFLGLVVAVSYGQLLQMFPWQDDHALMFKLAHIQDAAGYLGKGILGEGPYKYTAAYYYPVYLLFGYKISAFFFFSLIFYFLATLSVYFVFSKVISRKAGQIVGFLFATGFIASDGFIRLYNSVGTSLSVIFISFLLLSYWNFSQKLKPKWYFLALTFYFLAVEFVRYRTHYLIGVVLIFELIFLIFRRPLIRSTVSSLVRLIPFLAIFYQYFIVWGDTRSNAVGSFVTSILHGDFNKLYGLASSFANLVIPDYLSHTIFMKLPARPLSFFEFGLFKSPTLNIGVIERGVAVLGLALLAAALILFLRLRQNKKLYIFLLLWVVLNLASYAAYLPTHSYETTNRLLAHSFFAFAGLLGLLAIQKKWIYWCVVLLGLSNLAGSILWQRQIVLERSKPAEVFYNNLKKFVPKLNRGNILYFDVADDARGQFADAFSVAQMPEETAIAWQYGTDRYDIRRVTDYQSLVNLLNKGFITDKDKKELPVKKIYTFFYSKNGLIETTDKPSCALRPVVTFTLSAVPEKSNHANVDFPISTALAYSNFKSDFYKHSTTIVSSNWQNRVFKNLTDQDPNTVWQADRVTWKREKTFFGFDLKKTETIDRFVWINAFPNSSPITYTVEVSVDGTNWQRVIEVNRIERIVSQNLNEIKFESVNARYIRMVVNATLDNDSPGISEAWVIPVQFEKHSVVELESIIGSSEFAQLIGKDKVSILWKTAEDSDWQSNYIAGLTLITDGRTRSYSLAIPCHGTRLTDFKFDNFQYPASINLLDTRINYPKVQLQQVPLP